MKKYTIQKWYKRIRLLLVVILLATTVTAIYNYKKIKEFKSIQEYNDMKTTNSIEKTQKRIDSYYSKMQIFKDSCQKINELLVLEGTRQTKVTISNNDIDVTLKRSQMNFLQKWFNEMSTRTMTVYSTWDYSYAYDLNKLDCNLDGDTIHIILNNANVRLQPLAERKSETKVSTDEGFLTWKFSPQETNAVMERIWVDTMNSLRIDNRLHKMALYNTELNLRELASKIGIKVNIEYYEVYGLDVTDMENVIVENDSNY